MALSCTAKSCYFLSSCRKYPLIAVVVVLLIWYCAIFPDRGRVCPDRDNGNTVVCMTIVCLSGMWGMHQNEGRQLL